MKELVAIVDDEPDLTELVALQLKKNGYTTKAYHDAGSFLRSVQSSLPALIILDLMLPDMDGFEVCKVLKKNDMTSSIPVIMLTAKQSETDKVLGLELGADDYITKPFSPSELIARVRAVLRRSGQKNDAKIIKIDDILMIDLQKHEVQVHKKQVSLTLTEFKILELLAGQRRQVFSREQMLDQIWGGDKVVFGRTVDVHMKNLRDKLGPAGKMIKNIRGLGYKMS